LCVEGALDHHHAALLDMLYRYEIGIYTLKPSRYGGGGNGYWHEPIDSIIIMRVNLKEYETNSERRTRWIFCPIVILLRW
jgi:hypothetical protein